MHPDMSQHERRAWGEIEDWKTGTLNAKDRMPASVRRALERSKQVAGQGWDKVPGNDEIQAAVLSAMEGGFRFVNDTAATTLDRDRLLDKFAGVGPAPQTLADLRALDLEEVDRRMPNLGLRYSLTAAGEGIGAGFLMGAGATAGTVGALPAFGLIAGTLVADTVTLIGLTSRVASHHAAYCGYDTRKPAEALYMMSLLNVSSAGGQVGKQAAMRQVRQIAGMLARRKTWSELNEKLLVKITQRLFASLSERLTMRKLGQAIPILGAGIAGGLNYQFLRSGSDTAYFLYRERFLTDKYLSDTHAGATSEDEDIIEVEVLTDRIIEETTNPDEAVGATDAARELTDDRERDDT